MEMQSYPTVGRRLAATILDSIFDMALTVVILKLIFGDLRPSDAEGQYRALFVFVAISYLYHLICVSYFCTLGQLATGIRVRKSNGKRLNVFLVFVRLFLKTLLGWASFVIVIFDDKSRAIHDQAVDSIVIWKKDTPL